MGRTRAYTRILPFMSSIALKTRLRASASSCRPSCASAGSHTDFVKGDHRDANSSGHIKQILLFMSSMALKTRLRASASSCRPKVVLQLAASHALT